MKYVFLNPHSCSGLALKKWEKVKDSMPELKNYIVVNDFYKVDWEQFSIHQGDLFISAGGDGTLHSMVNALIKNKGIDVLNQIGIGHIGLGSNNSYLRPYTECTVVHDVPMRISEEFITQDLIEIEIKKNSESNKVFCVANASMGFLASANIRFNSDSDIAVLKKWNSDLADVYTFFKALMRWTPLEINYDINKSPQKVRITNMHFMKRPYYAADLGFPESIPPQNKKFRLNILKERARPVIIKKFLQMLLLKKFSVGRDWSSETDHVHLMSLVTVPIESDGEIYYGEEFQIKVSSQGIRLCK